MLENSPPLSAADPSSNVVNLPRLSAPFSYSLSPGSLDFSQIEVNRTLGRRKSGVDGEKNQAAAFRNAPSNDYRNSGSFSSENHNFGLIALEGCGNSEASQLLKARWAAAVNLSNDQSIDSSERPVMYSGRHIKLRHQLMSAGRVGSEVDFMGELRRAMQSYSSLTFSR